MRLEGLDGQEQRYLAEILARRLPTFARRFPVRHRRSEDLLIDPTSRAPEDEEDWEEGSEVEPETAPSEEGAQAPEAEGVDKHARLLQIRKSGKRILLVMHDDLDRAILAGTLQVDGFRRVQEARNFAEALACFRLGEVDLLILDQQIGLHPASRFLERLRAQGYCQDTPVVLTTDQADIRTTIMAKAMRISRLATKPLDYDGALRDVLYGLLGIAG
jgi:CheY-like chemotaxis protein